MELTDSDVNLLNGPFFLNDRIIEFYFNHLSRTHSSDDILLVSPTISFWLANCSDQQAFADFVSPLQLSTKSLILFTVNDCEVSSVDGGTHWSLLVYYRNSNTFVHHDSLDGYNHFHALRLCRAVKGAVICAHQQSTVTSNTDMGVKNVSELKNDNNNNNNNNKEKKKKKMKKMKVMLMMMVIKKIRKRINEQEQKKTKKIKKKKKKDRGYPFYYIEGYTPLQTNLYDCGLYVMATARLICVWYNSESRNGADFWFTYLRDNVDAAYLRKDMRKEVRELIQSFRHP